MQIICAVLWNLLAAGPVFGFAALKPILISEGVYADVCKASTTDNEPCVEQDLKLNFIFTVAAGLTNIVAFFVGFVLDNHGPRVCGFIGSFLLAWGSLTMAFAPTSKFDSLRSWFPSLDPYLCGYSLLALGGPFVFISTFQLANTFPKHSGKILASITGAFDTSSALFMIWRLIYQNYTSKLGIQQFFTGYLVVPVFIFLCQLFIMPTSSYVSLGVTRKFEIEGLDADGNLVLGDDGARAIPDSGVREEAIRRQSVSAQSTPSVNNKRVRQVSTLADRRKSILEEHVSQRLEQSTHGIYGILHDEPVSKQLATPWFVLMLCFTVICMLRINYFVATVRSQENYLLGSFESAQRMGGIFDIALPLGGLVAIPLIGIALDTISTLYILEFIVCVSVTIGILGCFHSFVLNLIGILILVVYRPFYYTVVSDYSAKVFGFVTFGTVYGLAMSISGVLNMLQSVIDRLTKTYFKSNPIPINIILTGLTLLFGVSLVTYAKQQGEKRLAALNSSAVEDYGAVDDSDPR